jgi:hypothetical protein
VRWRPLVVEPGEPAGPDEPDQAARRP